MPRLAPSERKREVCDIFCAFCELTRACTRAKSLTKPLAMLTCLLALVNPASVGQQVLAVVFLTSILLSFLPYFHLLTASSALLCQLSLSAPFCWLSIILTALSCLLSSSAPFCWLFLWELPSLVHFWSRGRSCAQALCVGFAPEQTKRFSDRHPHIHPYNECPTSCHIFCLNKNF